MRAEGGRSFFQRQEVLDLANVLQAIDDPLDQVALVASLRSTAFGCTRRGDLPPPRRRQPPSTTGVDARRQPRERRATRSRCCATCTTCRSRVSLAQLVRETLERTRLVEIALAGWDGQQSAANLVKLADRARAFSASGAGGLRAFARWLTEQRASSDEAEANVAEETDEVVRIMTIHASKGLEFPIVALANLGTRPRNDVEPVPDRRAHRLHLRIKNRRRRVQDAGLRRRVGAREGAEGGRGQAAPLRRGDARARPPDRPGRVEPAEARARCSSTCCRRCPTWDESAAGTLVDGCHVFDRRDAPAAPRRRAARSRPTSSAAAVDAALADRDAWEAARAATVDAARDELEVHPGDGGRGRQPGAGVPRSAPTTQPLIAGGGESPPRLKGEAMHKALELVDLAHPEQLDEIVPAVCLVAGIEDAADEVLELARACLASPVVARALAADELWREVPYTRRVEDGYATGRIDLVFREGDELVVVDWKSDSVGPSQVAGGRRDAPPAGRGVRERARSGDGHDGRARSCSCFRGLEPKAFLRSDRSRSGPGRQLRDVPGR